MVHAPACSHASPWPRRPRARGPPAAGALPVRPAAGWPDTRARPRARAAHASLHLGRTRQAVAHADRAY
ncbi:hypothetical protein, partial [Streptomyces goshikiensis]|uniref:hypothetical protein n=1 Tax=Streptomyces goshikiensis TaxID=1942 RepID=UPI00364F6B42